MHAVFELTSRVVALRMECPHLIMSLPLNEAVLTLLANIT